jgi:hypothetical protein
MAAPASVAAPLPEPLRLPRGSVRGLLALVLMGTFAYLLTRDSTTPQVLVNAVVVCLAFYFGTRGPTASSTATPGTIVPPSRRPRIVRGLLFLGFAGLAAWVLRTGLPAAGLPAQLLQVWEVLGGYLIGSTLAWLFHHRVHETPLRRRIALLFRDLSALGALALTVFACYTLVTGIVNPLGGEIEQALSLIITYYFGSRVIAH